MHILSAIFNDGYIRTFQDLQLQFDLPGSSFFSILDFAQQCVPMGCPGGQSCLHIYCITCWTRSRTSRVVSTIYVYLLKASYKPLLTTCTWNRDLTLDQEICWDTVWNKTLLPGTLIIRLSILIFLIEYI